MNKQLSCFVSLHEYAVLLVTKQKKKMVLAILVCK